MGKMVVCYFLVILCMAIGCAGQSMMEFGGGCFMDCLEKFGEKAKSAMPSSMSSSPSSSPLGSQQIQVGNVTVSCPAPMNRSDMAQLELVCDSAKDLIKCTDSCPDDMMKNITSAAIKPLKYMCVDKFEDVKKYVPCLSQACPDVQRTCVPTCGSMEEMAMKMKSMAAGGFGDSAITTTTVAPMLAAAVTTASNMMVARKQKTSENVSDTNIDIDSEGDHFASSFSSFGDILQMIGDMCSSVDCYMNCSRNPTIKKCGKEAFALNQDLLEMVFTTMNDMLTTLGMQDLLPKQCSALMGAAKNASSAANATQSPETTEAPVIVLANITSQAPTTSAANVSATNNNNETVSLKTHDLAASTKGSSAVTIPTMLLTFLSFVVFIKANRA